MVNSLTHQSKALHILNSSQGILSNAVWLALAYELKLSKQFYRTNK